MSNYNSLKATINANIKTNGNQEITGAVLNSVLISLLNSLIAGYQYIGVATPDSPGTSQSPDYKCFYITFTPGTYSYLGGLVVKRGEVAILKWDTTWTKETLNIPTPSPLMFVSIDGGGNTLSYSQRYYTFIPGRKYRIHVKSQDFSSVTSGSSLVKFGVASYSPESFLVKVTMADTLLDHYDFVVPLDSVNMRFCCRANSGTAAEYYIEDITDVVLTTDPSPLYSGIDSDKIASIKAVSDAILNLADYRQEDITIGDLTSETLSIRDTGSFATNGNHKTQYVEPGEIVKITGNASNNGRFAFVSGVACPNSGSTFYGITNIEIVAGKTYFLIAPSNAVAFIFNTIQGSSTDVTPASLSVFHPVSSSIENDLNGDGFRAIPVYRFAEDNNVLKYGASSTNVNRMFKVKSGHSYTAEISGNASIYAFFIPELPKIGLSLTSLGLTLNSSDYYNSVVSITAPGDGYIIFRVYKSSSPSLSVTLTEKDYRINMNMGEKIADDGNRIDFIMDNSVSFTRVNLDILTRRDGYIQSGNGHYNTGAGTSGYKHVLVPVTPGQIVKVKKGTNTLNLAWLTSNATPVAKGLAPFVSGTSLMGLTGDRILKVPTGANYLFVYLGNSPYNNTPAYVGIANDYDSMPGVVLDNDQLKTKRILSQFVGQTRSEQENSYKPLVLLHYSDIHGESNNQSRIDDFREFFAEYIDDTIQTGDVLADKWSDDFIFTDRDKDILSVIGNHDTATGTGESRNWHAKQGLDSYNRYFAPYVSYWDVIQPQGAATNGYCFYYKDYTDSKVRLIVLDTWNDDASYISTQETWLTSVLSDAITNGLSVIVASHFRLKSESLLKSAFSKPNAEVENPDSSGHNDPYLEIVKTFIANGGELVCWICGHAHYDAITKTSSENGNQISVCIANAGRWGGNNNLKINNSMIIVDDNDFGTFDLFNVMAVDVTYKTISLMRVGSHWDKYGRNIETTCIKYTTGEVIYY